MAKDCCATKEQQIPKAQVQMEIADKGLEEVLTILYQRLEPVLSSAGPKDSEKQECVYDCPLAALIQGEASRLERYHEFVNMILLRLEL